MRARVLYAAVTLLALQLAAARRLDQDFEFDDDAETAAEPRSHTYIYEPHNELCAALVCKKRELCLLRDARTALCANKKDILRKGDAIVAARGGGEEPDEVFYERGAAEARCVGCGGAARAQFLCGSDNRTYSSLCRLDLHNCVRRPAPPVTLACRGFCPCAPARRRAACVPRRMADRLLDWFSVLMERARGTAPAAAPFPAGCEPEVRWMFAHLDADGDGALDAGELYALRHDERERCLRPFLARCGARGGGGVSRRGWCGCLGGAARACAALARAARRGGGGGWAPACDARGFYRPRQCHAARAECWCVDAHGAELPGTRGKGEPPCGAAPQDDEDALGGSGDGEPRF